MKDKIKYIWNGFKYIAFLYIASALIFYVLAAVTEFLYDLLHTSTVLVKLILFAIGALIIHIISVINRRP